MVLIDFPGVLEVGMSNDTAARTCVGGKILDVVYSA